MSDDPTIRFDKSPGTADPASGGNPPPAASKPQSGLRWQAIACAPKSCHKLQNALRIIR